MRLVDLDTIVTTWHYNFEKEEYVAVQTTVGEMIDLNTHEGLSIPIIEIPEPHGRLGDLDELAKQIEHDRYHHTHTDGLAARHHIAEYGHFLNAISEAPTIIPAEEG